MAKCAEIGTIDTSSILRFP